MRNLTILALLFVLLSQSVAANHDYGSYYGGSSYGRDYGSDRYYQSSGGRVAETLSRDYSIDRTETNNVFNFVNRDASASQSATSSGASSGSLIGAQAGSQSGNANANFNSNQNGNFGQNGAYNSNYANSFSNAYPPYSNGGFGYGGLAPYNNGYSGYNSGYGYGYNPYSYSSGAGYSPYYGYYTPTTGSSSGNFNQNQNFNQNGNVNQNANANQNFNSQYNDAYSNVANQGYQTNFNTQSQASSRESSGTNATHILSERIKDTVKVEKLYQDDDVSGRYNANNRYYNDGYDSYYTPQEYRGTKYVYTDANGGDYRYNPSYESRYSRSYPLSTAKYDGTRTRTYNDGFVIRY